MRISHDEFFTRYVHPHLTEVAEWGAEVGFFHRDRAEALKQIELLGATIVEQAGVGSSVRFEQAQKRLENREKLRQAVLRRLGDIFNEWIGANAPVPTGRRDRGRALKNVCAVVFLPISLIVLWPAIAIARWSFLRHEVRERECIALTAAAKNHFTIHFARHADRGTVAAAILAKAGKE